METEKTTYELISESLLEHELQGPDFLTYVPRPKYPEQIETFSDLSPNDGEGYAIIVSGPMVYENHFVRDSIPLYRKHYPSALIILSTWNDTYAEYLDTLHADQVHVITSPKPENTGISNSENFGIPLRSGCCEVKHHKFATVPCTATVQRLYAPNTLAFLHGILDAFPMECTGNQKKRIIASGLWTRKDLSFCINTRFIYGHMDDLLAYWDDIPDTRQVPISTDDPESVRVQIQKQPGGYFVTRYLNEIECRELLPAARKSQSLNFNEWFILYRTQDRHPTAPEWAESL